jgi:subtilisin family serine protease
MKKRTFTASVIAVAVLASCTKNTDLPNSSPSQDPVTVSQANVSIPQNAAPGSYVANEMIVKFKSGTAETARDQALAKVSAKVKKHIVTKAMQHAGDGEGIYVVNTPQEVMSAVAQMKTLGEVVFAEPNFIYTHQASSNDPYFTNGSLWGMYGDASTPANQYGSQAAEAWAAGHTGSSSVYVGVIDEGAMYSHTDLAANFWANPFDPVDGVDNDGNGYVDDVHGWDFYNNDNSTFDGTADDHGTHVSGTIGASGGNGVGVAGVNWSITLISAKFLGSNGGTTADAIEAVDYITDLKTSHGLNIVATNNSWGGGGFSQALKDAISRAGAANILFVAAAGNSGVNIDSSPSYPASYDNSNIIAVAAIDANGAIASWSNYGTTSVDLGAPGVGIYSTLPGGSGHGRKATVSSSYGSYSGTSMATPHVTGACALYASTHPGATAAQIKSAVLSSVAPTASLSGKTASGGRLNASGF